ncbi:hypothetical protein [Hanamia caeni]|jgi:hypothetical protein|nr:hypothetical protein [Hanamia caeni]
MKTIIFSSMILLVTRLTKAHPFTKYARAIYETHVEAAKAPGRLNEATNGPINVFVFTRERNATHRRMGREFN